MKNFKRGTVIEFKRRGKVVTGKVVGKWASGEGDGYAVEFNDDIIDVHTKNIQGAK